MVRIVNGGGGGVEGSEGEERRGQGHEEGKKKKVVQGERGEDQERERRLEEAERERKMKEERKSRERNVIWKGVGGDNEEKRLWSVEEILKRILGREVGVRGMEERRGMEVHGC